MHIELISMHLLHLKARRNQDMFMADGSPGGEHTILQIPKQIYRTAKVRWQLLGMELQRFVLQLLLSSIFFDP